MIKLIVYNFNFTCSGTHTEQREVPIHLLRHTYQTRRISYPPAQTHTCTVSRAKLLSIRSDLQPSFNYFFADFARSLLRNLLTCSSPRELIVYNIEPQKLMHHNKKFTNRRWRRKMICKNNNLQALWYVYEI